MCGNRSLFFWMAFLLLGLATLASADGMLLPMRPSDPAFSVSYHRVQCSIDRQIATTEIDQAFRSHTAGQVEGRYIFPIADGMTISKFSMYDGGEELTHRILSKEEARRVYNSIVSTRRDPALLEWLGTRAIQASVFPILPNQDKRIRISYQEVLTAQGGVVKYVYPLKTEKLSSRPLNEVSVTIAIHSEQPIRSIYSPTHAVTVKRDGEYRATVTYNEKNVLPDQDLVLYYTVSEQQIGTNLLTYRDNKGDGYFLLLAAPKAEIRESEVQPKDVIFVLDTSGSMGGDQKIQQAKAALKYCIGSLNKRDRFNIVSFSSEVRRWREGLADATADQKKAAEAYVDDLRSEGGTNISDALHAAQRMLLVNSGQRERPASIIFLTDGLPTVGERNEETILASLEVSSMPIRIFTFGVGNDYNAHFLDRLAERYGGYAENVLPQEDIEVKVSDFYSRISTPLLMNLQVAWGGIETYDIYPKELPDLYKGSQVLIAGRYKAPAEEQSTLVTLSGDLQGRKQTFRYNVTFPTKAVADDFIPRLWATRKIGFLEDEARLHGADRELIQEIVRLSTEYGILTEYTSFLVDMDVRAPGGSTANALSKSKGDLTDMAYDRVTGMRDAKVGNSAVSQSVNRKANMNAAQVASSNGNFIVNEQGARVQMTQMRNISQRSFVQNGTQWVDINAAQAQRRIKVKAFSPAYFQLANAHPRLAQYMSQNGSVVVAVKDTAIEVGSDGQEAEFKPEEMKKLTTDINAEFGEPFAMGSGLPIAMVLPAGGDHRWVWGLALVALALSVATVGRMRRRQ
ncbi:MAG TPA: VIT and VWA domain-containing protein [Armatimonadota bacterium]